MQDGKDVQAAKHKCFRLLTYRPRTEYELQNRLKEAGFDNAVIEETMTILYRTGLINDQLFANDWVNWRLSTKPVGREYLRSELRHKGVDSAIIEQALKDYDAADELDKALAVAQKRAECTSRLTRSRLAGYLGRRGFPYAVVIKVCDIMADNGRLDIS